MNGIEPAAPVALVVGVTSTSTAAAAAAIAMWENVGARPVQWPPRIADAAAHQLVVAVDGHGRDPRPDAVDVWTDGEGARDLLRQRLIPFRDNLAAGRRAPRRRSAELVAPDPEWAACARRVAARLARIAGDAALRIDHIGSTSVPGLPAKDLVDLQVVVRDLRSAEAIAARAGEAGLVPVPGRWQGLDRSGERFDELPLVDADPGRPVNVNLRPVHDPVWREALLFRDWLSAEDTSRDRYLAAKQRLAATTDNVDDYSDGKQAWIGPALTEASRWAAATGWHADG